MKGTESEYVVLQKELWTNPHGRNAEEYEGNGL
jgi:hypothetical protein